MYPITILVLHITHSSFMLELVEFEKSNPGKKQHRRGTPGRLKRPCSPTSLFKPPLTERQQLALLMQMTDVNRHIGEAELFTPWVIGLQHIKCLLLEQVCIWCHFPLMVPLPSWCQHLVPLSSHGASTWCHFPLMVPLSSHGVSTWCHFPLMVPAPGATFLSWCQHLVPLSSNGASTWCHFPLMVSAPGATFL